MGAAIQAHLPGAIAVRKSIIIDTTNEISARRIGHPRGKARKRTVRYVSASSATDDVATVVARYTPEAVEVDSIGALGGSSTQN